MSVHRERGRGFLEPVYQDALEQEFLLQNIPLSEKKSFPYFIKKFACDPFIGWISSREESQVLNYLKASGFHRALLINFGAKSLEHKRIVLDHK